MTEIALCGNATDLSFMSNLSLEQINSLQGREAIAKSQRNIVDNDIKDVWAHLTNALRLNYRINIVLDNAGFEFFTDVLCAANLLESGLVSSIRFHVKDFPRFVSDVTPVDVDSFFSHLESPDLFANRENLDPLLRRVQKHFESSMMTVVQHRFWTTAYLFHEMPLEAPDLFEDLKASSLVIFKGDLNYHKLTKDGLWSHTTPFEVAMGPLRANNRLNVLALRTNKADFCVGIDGQGKVNALNEEAPHTAWIRNGNYDVISFSDGE